MCLRQISLHGLCAYLIERMNHHNPWELLDGEVACDFLAIVVQPARICCIQETEIVVKKATLNSLPSKIQSAALAVSATITCGIRCLNHVIREGLSSRTKTGQVCRIRKIIIPRCHARSIIMPSVAHRNLSSVLLPRDPYPGQSAPHK